jgi:hypothetical protein
LPIGTSENCIVHAVAVAAGLLVAVASCGTVAVGLGTPVVGVTCEVATAVTLAVPVATTVAIDVAVEVAGTVAVAVPCEHVEYVQVNFCPASGGGVCPLGSQ